MRQEKIELLKKLFLPVDLVLFPVGELLDQFWLFLGLVLGLLDLLDELGLADWQVELLIDVISLLFVGGARFLVAVLSVIELLVAGLVAWPWDVEIVHSDLKVYSYRIDLKMISHLNISLKFNNKRLQNATNRSIPTKRQFSQRNDDLARVLQVRATAALPRA